MAIDPIAEGAETEAFWRMITAAEMAVEALQRSEQEPPERFKRVIRGRYRLSYLCHACNDEHRVEGDWPQVCSGFQILLLQGARSVTVETIEFALIADAAEADEIVAEAPPEHGAAINAKLQRDFFSRKP